MSLTTEVAGAYSATGAAWQRGPGRVYDRLADALVDACPVPIDGARVLDLGAGTGAATRAARRRGADVVAVDVAIGMLAATTDHVVATAGDACALPFRRHAFDAVFAAFSLNHLLDPAAGVREAIRVTRRGGAILASAYAADDAHPVKEATEAAALARGWTPAPWVAAVSKRAAPNLATVERAASVGREAGLDEVDARLVRVEFADLGPADLVAWRLGMAQLAPFVATMPEADLAALAADAIARLGDAPVLERSFVVLSGRVR